jgi:hypothetical protein
MSDYDKDFSDIDPSALVWAIVDSICLWMLVGIVCWMAWEWLA